MADLLGHGDPDALLDGGDEVTLAVAVGEGGGEAGGAALLGHLSHCVAPVHHRGVAGALHHLVTLRR